MAEVLVDSATVKPLYSPGSDSKVRVTVQNLGPNPIEVDWNNPTLTFGTGVQIQPNGTYSSCIGPRGTLHSIGTVTIQLAGAGTRVIVEPASF